MKKIIVLIITILILTVGCVNNKVDVKDEKEDLKEDVVVIEKEDNLVDDENTDSEEVKVSEETSTENDDVDESLTEKPEPIDLEKIRPNEAGRIMVIMYHSLGDKESQFVSTPEIFRKDLEKLNSLGYVSVSLSDYVNNSMDIPAGKSPVVLTFDDGHSSNFTVEEKDGEINIDPNSAVGIMDEFYEKNPEFGKEATFFLNGNTPFGQEEYVDFKLNYLVENGYDIGNHTYNHENLTNISSLKLQKTLGSNKNKIESYLVDYEVNTLALPFGSRPKNEQIEEFVYEGSFEGEEYKHIAVLNVGWNPARSPIHKNFNYKSINRVQAGSMKQQLVYWIDYLEKRQDQKYVSDGDINKITIPNGYEEYINKDKIGDKELILYERK